ncbi:MAG: hypothetical protein Q4P28_02710 [Tissierellia bacterium]|nr:hypothetical protein [Tissierellia bacterium]
MEYEKDQKRKILVYLQMLLIILVFFVVYLVQIKNFERRWIWIALLAFVAFAYYRFSYTSKKYVTIPMARTKPLNITMRLLPVFAALTYIFLPHEKGVNCISAGVIFAIDTLLKDKTNRYFTPKEYEAFKKKVDRKKR